MNDKKLDKISDDIGEIKVTIAKQQVQLDDHIRRTELLEGTVKEDSMARNQMLGAVKLLKIVGVIAAICEALHVVVGHL